MADAFPAATDTIPTVWEPLVYRFDLTARNGERAVLEVGPKLPRGQHVVRRAGSTDVMLVGPWRFTRFKKGWGELTAGTTGPKTR
ncbi:MAG: hypothetical protein FD129_623 [bacterium]|nr:MAG: hypothetical protein FD129_623 [bacterium]